MLYLVEYANFNTQDVLSYGLANASSTDWNNYNSYNPLVLTGTTNTLGNGNGEVAIEIENFVGGTGTLETQTMRYRGIENWYAHIWKFMDGINVYNSIENGSQAFVCLNPSNFASDTETNYKLECCLSETDGFAESWIPGTFLPSSVGGSSTTYMCDYYYTYFDNDPSSGWRVVLSGGNAFSSGLSGAFCVYSISASSYSDAYLGARLCYRKQ